jgi:vacuolar-type H+-ATPase subunit I/STV1
MSSSSSATAVQAVRLGELKMAEGLITQRVNATTKAVNEAEALKLEEVRRTVVQELGLDKATAAFKALQEKVEAKIASITDEARKKIEAANNDSREKREKVQADIEVEKTKLDELKSKIENEVGKRGAEIRQKAANIRANLAQELNKLNDQIYATILPANLRAVVDQAPRIGDESKFVALEFKK